jgi:GT2 family glycosyltransferase
MKYLNTEVGVIIINYKTSHLIQGLINSIFEENIQISIFLLDNGSTEETFLELKDVKDDRLIILRSQSNLGFAGGTNFLVNYISKYHKSINYIFLLNPDALCQPNLIGGLLNILMRKSNAACISPQIINENGKPGYSGGIINYKKGVVVTSLFDNEKSDIDFFEIDVFSGCAVLLNLKKFEEVGKFNEDLFMYFDEADVSIKFKKLGFKVLYTPKYKILHDHSYTTRDLSYIKTYYLSRNKFKIFNNSMTLSQKLYFAFHEFAYHLKYKRAKNALYHLKGIFHYLTGRMGNGFPKRK